jgi:hypothetical protein
MLNFNFSINNVWNKNPKFRIIWIFIKPITKNKTLELECYQNAADVFKVKLEFNPIVTDHGGITVTVNMFSYTFDMSIYDNRHWN